MAKRVHRHRRRPAKALELPANDDRTLLARLLDTPQLARVVPRLPANVLHRIIERCGLEDCGEIVALATPDQLRRVFDLDLWRTAEPGRDEQFDAERFGVWLEVLVDCGAAAAARQLARMDLDLVVTGLAQHVRVFDLAAIVQPDGVDEDAPDRGIGRDDLSCEIGGYLIVARRDGWWDAIVEALTALDAEDPARFHEVMRDCRGLSNSRPEIDGLDELLVDRDQAMFDLAIDRERRREQDGFAAPADARAFLQMARRYRPSHGATPQPNPLARAYFRGAQPADDVEEDDKRRALVESGDVAPDDDQSADAFAAVVGVLVDAGVMPQSPRGLLHAAPPETTRFARLQAQLRFVHDADENAASERTAELAYLANALVAGCSIQGRPFTPHEASEAAAAVCNLGLENWPSAVPDGFVVANTLVDVFQHGWAVLHDRVCMHAARHLTDVLGRVRCGDSDIQRGLDVLRRELMMHGRDGAPWRARAALDVIATLDLPAWAALLALIDECPTMHAAVAASCDRRVRAVPATAFEFISENAQIASIDAFLRALPDTLRQ